MNDPTAQAALDRALDEKERLLLVYQPIHDARTGAIWAVEALLRQRRSTGEIREASIITEAAEESCGPELFVLDSMVVKEAYTQAAGWQRKCDIRLNVNLSPREFQEGNVLDRLTSLVTSCGIDTHKVNLELTETSYLEHPDETMEVMQELRKLGLHLWLDDFGTGHSSITHLQKLPVEGLKISGAFIRPMLQHDRSRAIVRALIDLAHDVGMAVIAEEVETQEQLDALLAMGCEYIQGFLFSKPMKAEELDEVLRAGC